MVLDILVHQIRALSTGDFQPSPTALYLKNLVSLKPTYVLLCHLDTGCSPHNCLDFPVVLGHGAGWRFFFVPPRASGMALLRRGCGCVVMLGMRSMPLWNRTFGVIFDLTTGYLFNTSFAIHAYSIT